jgi:hypothetical protein
MPDIKTVVEAWIIGAAATIVGLLMTGAVLLVLGEMIDGANERSADHERCLKHATNGYESKECR